MIHICTKFELSSTSHSVDRRGSQIFNEGHMTRATLTVGGNLYLVG